MPRRKGKKRYIPCAVFFTAVFVVVLSLSRFCNSFETQRVCVKEVCFTVEVARTPAERARGLMYRSRLEEDKGMLFVYPDQQRRAFWMKNTLIPLDIIWLDGKKAIVNITENAEPCGKEECVLYESGTSAQYVLEVNAGTAEQFGLTRGDIFTFFLK